MSHGQQVIVLICSRLPPLVGHRTDCDGLEQLELTSTCFEQFLLQDVRDGAGLMQLLGGDSAVAEWTERLRAGGRSVRRLLIEPSTTPPGDAAGQTRVRDPRLPVDESFIWQLPTAWDDSLTATLQATDLVWICVDIPADQELLAVIFDRIRSISREDSTLVLTTLDACHPVPDPTFVSDADVTQTHVPLWIREPGRWFQRTQSLVGSFELLPAVVQTLLGDPPDGLPRRSLVNDLLTHPRPDERCIRLTGPGWTAVRSDRFLLVTRDPGADDDASDSAAEHRRLYLKPEDLWNVHDVIGMYPDIADELDNAARCDPPR